MKLNYALLGASLLAGNTGAFAPSSFSRHATFLQASSLDTEKKEDKDESVSFRERVASSGAATAAAMATAAVNAAVSMKTLEAPDLQKSYVALDLSDEAKTLDEEGLPRVYDRELIQQYWTKEKGALNQRWGVFVGKAVPFFSKLVTLFIRDGKISESEIPALSKQARVDIEDLGATFIKLGQMMSIRPDVLPQATLDELTKLQDSVEPFETSIAVEQIERELGGPLGEFFTSISEEPVAAASLAQVYLATLNDGKDTKVAVKVQRPSVLGTVSKDLYVLRRAAEVWQGLVDRFAPQQRTNYVALFNEWAIGFYTELDFSNEAKNQQRLKQDLLDNNVQGVMVPKVYEELCTRRILVSEWIDGERLSSCSQEELAELTPLAQEAFLVQLFETGFFHADPHPGNLLKLNEPTAEGYRLAVIDCGLMATIDPIDSDNMISTLIHLANKDYASLVDDFVKLKILPEDSNRAAIIPLMDKALSPYVKGGGAKRYEEELKKMYGMEEGSMSSQVGGFQAMTQDALTVLNEVPFSIPPYFAILGRAIVTLEGVALSADPEYGLIMEAYPFIARKLLREDRPEIQSALQEVLFSGSGGRDLKLSRLLVLLNNAAGSVATQDGAAFVDLDSVPEDGIGFSDGLKYILSDKAESLRNLLEKEVDTVVDILGRQFFRKGITEALVALTPPKPPSIPFLGDIFPQSPKLDEIPLPLLLPRVGADGLNVPSVSILTLKDFTDVAAPKLNQDEDIYAIGLAEAAKEFFGDEIGELVRGEGILTLKTGDFLLGALRSGALGGNDLLSNDVVQNAMSFVSNTVASARGSEKNKFEGELTEAIENLNVEERQRLDDIVSTITETGLQSVLERIAKIQ